LKDLKDTFATRALPDQGQSQRRFVIFGLGGSGKTQFCCKFAQDNRQRFWGIFWIDASSDENAEHTFARIAEIGGVEPNERAAKSWLSSLEYPWLLVIDEFDEIRLRVALKELKQLSLITHHRIDGNDSYSMHSLVHTWVRQRPQMSTAEQATWSHAAATMLSQNILLPPLGLREADIKLRIDLMPHVDHVSKCRDQIKARILDNQRTRRKPWPVLVGIFRLDRLLALQYAKFSLVYSQCGRWHEAAKLQLTVKEYVCSRLGIEHPVAMRIVGALSGTYMQLSRTNEAAELQEQILQACVESLGSEHPKTLKVLDTLGSIRLFQGRFKDALRFGQEALDGMSRTLGTDNEDTLRAMENEARVLLEKAAEGMKRVLGPTHLDTLAAMESLAMTYLELSGDLLPNAREMMEEVLEQRKEKLGKEQPYTLLAICNLGRIRSVMGEHEAAEQMMRPALRIAERNLGENHFGTLAGKAHLARVIALAGRFQEAEAMYKDVIKSEPYQPGARDGEHPDRIMAMWALLHCYQTQGKVEPALPLLDEMVEALGTLRGQAHPFAECLLDKRRELLAMTPTSPTRPSFS